MKTAFFLCPLLFLSQCAPVTRDDDVAHKLAPGLYEMTTPRTPGTEGITIPILRSPDFEARSGKPLYSVMADGSYIAWYEAGPLYLQIIGTRRSGIFRTDDVDGTTTILGRTTGYFGTGNETGEYTTNPLRLTHPDGRSANYFIIYGTDGSGSTDLRKFPSFSW